MQNCKLLSEINIKKNICSQYDSAYEYNYMKVCESFTSMIYISEPHGFR